MESKTQMEGVNESFKEILAKEGVSFEESNTLEHLGGVINYEGLEVNGSPQETGQLKKDLDGLVAVMRIYSAMPILTDCFGSDHIRRREWRNKMTKMYGKEFDSFLDSNKVKKNNIAGVLNYSEFFVNQLRRFKVSTPRSTSMIQLLEQFPEIGDYLEIDLQEKLRIVARIDNLCKSFIELATRE